MGFRANPEAKHEREANILRQLLPEDLLKYGLIPEFIGRLPVIATLDTLDEDALVRILCEPKNAILKQYAKFFEMDGVELIVEPAAMREIAREAINRKTGARALRAIIEQLMLDVMYEVPSNLEVKRVILPAGAVSGDRHPILMTEDMIRQAS